ncbi:CD151 antigen-like [Uloborus diversus]|uniref:CD151 antigen-like n=1 Tax=Uloborus diversus TaxID=327109 RepID=UPI0024099C75|nr:CD151 antigen-like [Uloborus diversus]
MVQGCSRVIKFFLFFFNFIALCAGVAILGFGIWGLSEKNSMERLLGVSFFMTISIIVIVGGVLIVLISFLGCCGAVRESKTMLCLFSIILLALFIGLLTIGILGYIYWGEVEAQMKQEMLNTIEQYQQDAAVTDAWDTVQQFFQCCGISGNNDYNLNIWKRNPNFQSNATQVPESCCKAQDNGTVVQCQADPYTYAYSEDCYVAVRNFFQNHSVVIGAVAIVVACILFLGSVLACTLFNKIRREQSAPAQSS